MIKNHPITGLAASLGSEIDLLAICVNVCPLISIMDETSQATECVDKTDPVTARKRKAKQNAKAKRVKITGAVTRVGKEH